MRSEVRQQIEQSQPAIGCIEQHRAQLVAVIVGEDNIEVGNNGSGNNVFQYRFIVAKQLEDTAGCFMGELVVARQGRLNVGINQQYVFSGISEIGTQVCSRCGFTDTTLGGYDGSNNCHGRVPQKEKIPFGNTYQQELVGAQGFEPWTY